MSDEPRVLVGHPSTLVRSLITSVLARRGLTVVGSVGRVADLSEGIERLRAQVVVCGARFPDADLVPVIAQLLASGARVLVVARQDDDVAELLFAGASGCLFVEDATPTEVAHAVHTVWAGHSTLHPVAAHAVLSRWRAQREPAQPVAEKASRTDLTAREHEVLVAMADGLATRGIAERLHISTKTVEAHKARVFAKLGARNHAHAITLATAQGLLGRL